jgi:polysaccharide export outer membrane protein
VACHAGLAAAVFLLLGVFVVAGGCAGGPDHITVDIASGSATADTEPVVHTEIVEAGRLAEYYLEVGDRIRVDFFFAPELTTDLLIRPDGRITLPAIGDLMAVHRTPGELADEIETAFSDILLDPTVAVIVQEVATPKVFVVGMVQKPGPVEFRRSLSATTAIASAGGATIQGKMSSVVVLRRVSTGRVAVTRLDLAKVFEGADPSQDMFLEADDIVFVPKRYVSQLRDFALDVVRVVVPAYNLYRNAWYE